MARAWEWNSCGSASLLKPAPASRRSIRLWAARRDDTMSLLGLLGRGFAPASGTPPPPTVVDPLLLQVAEVVRYEINLGSYSQSVSAVRYYQPQFELSEMNTLHVSVVPRSMTEKQLSRAITSYDGTVDVGIQKRSGMDQATLDALTKLVAEIAQRLRTAKLTALPEARLMQLVNEPVFAPEHLDELRQFSDTPGAETFDSCTVLWCRLRS